MTGEAVETQEAPPAEKLAAVLGAAVLGAADAAVGMAQGVTLEVGERLNEDLDMARVKQIRGKDYLAVHDVIRTANRIFGFGRWGHEVVELASIGSTPKTAEDGRSGVYVGYRCTVRLTVAGCLPVCGVGYGDGVEYQEQSAVTAHELAVKEAESDALKRAFRNFGDQFGLILYAKADEKKRIAAEKATKEADRIANDPEAREKLDGEKRADLIHTWANKETPSKPAHARTVQDVLDLAARVGDEERTKAERAIEIGRAHV